MKFYRAYVQFLNFAVRLFGALALFVGIVSLGCAYVFTADRGMRVVAGIFLVAVGAAVFLAKPITVEHITRMRQRMGRSD
jgi:cytochrome c biogenesis factor